jgi:hypothetical protein
VFIELTDHLRCTADHAESYLVLLPGQMKGREVVTGELGCPACGRVVRIEQGVADFGAGTPSDGSTGLSANALAALLGISGPGGYVALVGGVTSLAEPLAKLLPDVGLVLINPAVAAAEAVGAGILRAGRFPLKGHSMRGVVLGADHAREPWLRDAAAAVLSGLRLVAEGGDPPDDVIELMARSPACWVGRKP